MNFKIHKKEFLFLASLTLAIGFMQVLTPLFLRTLIDGVLPSKDGHAIAVVLLIIASNELLLVVGNSLLNKKLDELEKSKISSLRRWMLEDVLKLTAKIRDPESFYQSWSVDVKRLVYKKIKNPWYRTKDFIILTLLTLICLNISYLAGALVLVIAFISMVFVLVFQEKQGKLYRELYSLTPVERRLFDEIVQQEVPFENKQIKLSELQNIGQEVSELQFAISKEQTRNQDLNNVIRFLLMFSILGMGGYLFSTDKLTMGSLWALLITMYRITPSLQSIIRWILQAKSDKNLEGRIVENMRTKESFKKPPYYNRLVKILEKAIKNPSQKIILVDSEIDLQELKNSLVLWRSFYSKKENVIMVEEKNSEWEDSNLYLAFEMIEGPLPIMILIFMDPNQISGQIELATETLTLK